MLPGEGVGQAAAGRRQTGTQAGRCCRTGSGRWAADWDTSHLPLPGEGAGQSDRWAAVWYTDWEREQYRQWQEGGRLVHKLGESVGQAVASGRRVAKFRK